MNLHPRLHRSIGEVDAAEWDACAGGHPYTRHAFLSALEDTGCLSRQRGVQPAHITLTDDAGAVWACAPGMLKWGNKREFGPEMAWLKAGLDNGCFRWPKLQLGIPWFPRLGPRLLVRPGPLEAERRRQLLAVLLSMRVGPDAASTTNIMHCSAQDARECLAHGALISHEWRSVWRHQGWPDLAAYLASLPHKKRHQYGRERQGAQASGMEVRIISGHDASPEVIHRLEDGFEAVVRRHGGTPWLPRGLFAALCRTMPDAVRLLLAFQGKALLAGVFGFEHGGTLHLDAWCCREPQPHLVFELLCHRPIAYAIERGLHTIDAGVAAEHKSHRGYAREPVFHAHWPAHHALRQLALARGARYTLMPSA